MSRNWYLLFIFLLSVSLLSCKKGIKTALPEKTNPNLKLFGYTLIDVGWDDPSDKNNKTNYTDEIQEFSNLGDILVLEPSDFILDRLIQMNAKDVSPILHLSEIFFQYIGTGGKGSGAVYALRPDYQARWDQFVLTNSLTTHQNLVGAFYIGEEPLWNDIPEDEFTMATDYAKLTIPQVPIFLVEAFGVADKIYTPNSVDWIGFDHYFLKQPSKDVDFQNEYAAIKSRMKPHQKLILIMDSHWIKIIHGSTGIGKGDMDFIARDYYNMANSDTSVIGILGYFWPNGFDRKGSKGTRGLPKHVLEEHKRIGKEITGK